MADNIKQGLHGCSREDAYVRPQDPLIQERLEWFQDQKLALMMHYGPYSQLGMDASWSLSDGDASWSRRDVDWEKDGEAYRRQYTDMYKTFNPVRFQPDKWAQFAADNGFKYLIFTTKHHDGFCMFDSQYTDYKITSPDCPFHTHKYADIVKEVFDAFRKKDIAIAAYFSKPDWHCPWYWAEGMDRPVAYNRNPTYTPAEHPEIWEQFAQFTKNQILELMQNYGRIEIIWLDGGQVKPQNGQDVHMSDIIAEARKIQPWLISADRTVGGENENYITPEQSVPDRAIRVPWESCVTVGTKWGFRFDDTYKSSRTLIHMLIQTISRGGNLALNVGPQPNGELPAGALRELEGLGAWLRANGDAVYATRAAEQEQIGNIFFTKKADQLYAFFPLQEDEALSDTVLIPVSRDVTCVTLLSTGENLTFTKSDEGICVTLPATLSGKDNPAPVFRLA
ncbi:MAG: alpha-L-fucosidase [Clostridia bacterium]|nr:alpha-L-fucosidase [Clostridia bacterium]